MSAWRRTPLWLRLVTAALVLASVAIALTGFFGAQLLRDYMTDRVDDQLHQALATVTTTDMLDNLNAPRPKLPSQYHVTFEDAETDQQSVLQETLRGDRPELPTLTPSDAEERSLEPFTVPAVDGHGSFRAVAIQATATFRSGETRTGTLVIAVSLDEVNSTVHRLVRIDLLVGGAVLTGLALAGYWLVRASLRPLTEIERTAAAIAGGELSRRVPDNNPSTEVGRLGRALNSMLNQIETAFRARQASEASARRSEEEMRRFVADASHELRTPLTSIRGFAELHRQGAVTDPAEVSQLLGRIEDEAKRMGLLVNDLLLLARLDQQRPFERAPVDLRVIGADAVEAAHATAPQRDIRLAIDGSSGRAQDDDRVPANGATAGFVVAGDESRLRQVLTNLLDNALAYSPADTPVTVQVERASRDGDDLVVLEVRDQGPGLTPEQAERVFERFYRTDKARSRAHGGTGLGLSIVAAITAAHGGTVEVATEPGRGATFRVVLPVAEPVPPPPEPLPPATPGTTPGVAPAPSQSLPPG